MGDEGTHAELFSNIGAALGITDEPFEEILEGAIQVVRDALVEDDTKAKREELEFRVELHKDYMAEAKKVDLKNMKLRNFRETLYERCAEYREEVETLKRLESELRTKQIHHGVSIDISPPNLPLVEDIQKRRKSVEAMEDAAVIYLRTQIEEYASKRQEALDYRRDEVQASYDALRAQKGESND